jgi:pyrrolidone-carboxylate peptidase
MILVYAFSNRWGTNISRRTLGELQKILSQKEEINYQIIFYHPRIFFNKYIKNTHYSLIIGLGDFWGEGDKIRIETAAKNAYGQETIYPLAPIRLEISMPDLEIYDPKVFSISENMGTYNCNWLVFMTQLQFNQHQSEGKQIFFHLPKRATAEKTARNISLVLTANQMLE